MTNETTRTRHPVHAGTSPDTNTPPDASTPPPGSPLVLQDPQLSEDIEDGDEEMRRFNAMPDHPPGSVDPSDDFDEDEEAFPSLCGATGRPHRWVYSSRREEDVCGDCGAY